ncbi:response regulator transcription factor [Paraburkholderia sp. Cpub6]|uniref:response regulator transcription factor n=1 Tax=Paraburkholderia sp. Cpub6 TaxID=2723094 RepID=UPI00160E6F9F|nr:response regulator [Paraburkholderia sp. Cpub6]MBB5460276.1 FixJ family two-component response regulator [Paraburkholderia sp. Cpub6]
MEYPEPVVFVVDDDDFVRTALARLIRSAGHRVEVFASAGEFLAGVNAAACPACLVLDVQLPDINGLQLQRKLDGAVPIIFITGYGDIPMSVHAMKAGASDFLAKPVSEADLLSAIELALGRAKQLHASRRERDKLCGLLDRLTSREREVLALIATGRLNKQIADELGTVEQTIKAHRARVMRKMEVTSLAQLVHTLDRFDMLSAADSRRPD